MLERVCRTCRAGNPLEAINCVTCGAALEDGAVAAPLARRTNPTSLTNRIRQSPLLRSPVAKSVALGVAALALDVGAALLSKKGKAEPSTALVPANAKPNRAWMRRREWEEFDEAGNLRRRVVEHILIRDE